MKTHYLFKFSALLLVWFAMLGCKEEWTADSPIHFRVYGTVIDSRTGAPVRNAEITLYYGTHTPNLGSSNPHGAAGSSVSGADGQYELPCIATDNLISANRHWYQIEAICNGYNDYSKELTIMETEGAEIQMDILLN